MSYTLHRFICPPLFRRHLPRPQPSQTSFLLSPHITSCRTLSPQCVYICTAAAAHNAAHRRGTGTARWRHEIDSGQTRGWTSMRSHWEREADSLDPTHDVPPPQRTSMRTATRAHCSSSTIPSGSKDHSYHVSRSEVSIDAANAGSGTGE